MRQLPLILLILTSHNLLAAEAEVVVGGLLSSEGGDWDPTSGPLLSPFGVDFSPSGEMWIVELEGGRVFRRDLSGTLHHVGGNGSRSYLGDGGPLSAATFNGMHNCATAKNGDLYIADSWNHCIRKVDALTGRISTIAGTGEQGFSGDGGPAIEATFDYVMCITLNPSGTVLHVADLNNHRVRAVDLKSGNVTTIAGNGMIGIPVDGTAAISSPLVDPRAVAQDRDGHIWILERGGHALRVVRTDGTIHTVAGTGQRGYADGAGVTAELGSPKHLCVGGDGGIYIADDENAAIRKYSPQSGELTTVLGRGHGDSRITLSHPHGVAWHEEWLYVVDMSHNRILRLKP